MTQVRFEKKVDGQGFVKKLDNCQTLDEIVTLLKDTMSVDTIKDRLAHMSDNDLVIALRSQAARVNTESGYKTTHEDMLIMAADKYQKMMVGEKGEKTKDFKKALREDLYPASKTAVMDMSITQQLIRKRKALQQG